MESYKWKYLAKIIKENRVKLGISQKTFAEKLGHNSSQYISNVERGLCSLNSNTFPKAAKALRIPLSKLIDAYVKDEEKKIRFKLKNDAEL